MPESKMKEFLFFITDYLKGKSVYAPVVKIMDFLFSVSITSYIFSKVYFPYTLINLTDYRGIYSFFVNGDFWPPFIIFLIIYFGLGFIAQSIFILTNLRYELKIKTKILAYGRKKKDLNRLFKNINNNPIAPIPFKVNHTYLLQYIQKIKDSVKPEQWKNALNKMERTKENLLSNFKVTIKAIIAITLYFMSLSHFGWLLYLISLLVLISLLIFFFLSHLLLEILPVAVQKVDAEYVLIVQESLKEGTK
jgi:hypothetical protein